MDSKQLCCIRNLTSPATLYYVIALQIREEVTTDTLFIILRQVITVTNHNKKIIDELYKNTRCPKSLGHILTLNMSKTIKEITMHLIYSESLQSQVFYRMFKDVQCEHR